MELQSWNQQHSPLVISSTSYKPYFKLNDKWEQLPWDCFFISLKMLLCIQYSSAEKICSKEE